MGGGYPKKKRKPRELARDRERAERKAIADEVRGRESYDDVPRGRGGIYPDWDADLYRPAPFRVPFRTEH